MSQHRKALRRTLSGFAAAYTLALSLIAIIALASHWISQRVTTAQVNAAHDIDVSGAQRMLSQRIALLLGELASTTDRAATLADLREARDRFRSAHLGLVNGDPVMRLKGVKSKELGDIYFYPPHLVNERSEALIFAADRVLLSRNPLPEATLLEVKELSRLRRIPAVMRFGVLILAAAKMFARQPVMLHIVHSFQLDDRHGAHDKIQDDPPPTEQPKRDGQKSKADDEMGGPRIRRSQDALSPSSLPVRIDRPGGSCGADHGPRQEAPEPFIVTRGHRVLRRRDIEVVIIKVLGCEVTVED